MTLCIWHAIDRCNGSQLADDLLNVIMFWSPKGPIGGPQGEVCHWRQFDDYCMELSIGWMSGFETELFKYSFCRIPEVVCANLKLGNVDFETLDCASNQFPEHIIVLLFGFVNMLRFDLNEKQIVYCDVTLNCFPSIFRKIYFHSNKRLKFIRNYSESCKRNNINSVWFWRSFELALRSISAARKNCSTFHFGNDFAKGKVDVLKL